MSIEEILGSTATAKFAKGQKGRNLRSDDLASNDKITKQKAKRVTKRQEITEVLTTTLSPGNAEPSDIIKRATKSNTMEYLVRAARALKEEGAEQISEEYFLAKASEARNAMRLEQQEAHQELLARTAAKKARREAQNDKSLAKVTRNVEPDSGDAKDLQNIEQDAADENPKKKRKQIRTSQKLETIDLLASKMQTGGEARARKVFERANNTQTLMHILEAARALPTSGVSEADFMAKVAEVRAADPKYADEPVKPTKAAEKAAKKEKRAKKAEKMAAKQAKAKEQREVIPQKRHTQGHGSQSIHGQPAEDIMFDHNAVHAQKGFSHEFWRDLAGSRAAAAIAAM